MMMESLSASAASPAQRPRRYARRLLWGAGILLALVGGFLAWRAWGSPPAGQKSQASGRISAAALEEQHGLRVRLVGVTAGGGMVDFRLKITDPGKARRFLLDPANMPIKMTSASGVELLAADAMDEDITWEEGSILFMLLPNTGGAIQPGASVTITFGALQLEPTAAQ